MYRSISRGEDPEACTLNKKHAETSQIQNRKTAACTSAILIFAKSIVFTSARNAGSTGVDSGPSSHPGREDTRTPMPCKVAARLLGRKSHRRHAASGPRTPISHGCPIGCLSFCPDKQSSRKGRRTLRLEKRNISFETSSI